MTYKKLFFWDPLYVKIFYAIIKKYPWLNILCFQVPDASEVGCYRNNSGAISRYVVENLECSFTDTITSLQVDTFTYISYLSIFLSIYLSKYLSIYQIIFLSIYLSILYLSIYLFRLDL